MSHRLKKELFQKGRELQIPVSGTFELTKRCNLNCRMCYIHDAGLEQELSAKEWILLGQQACKQGMLYLLLTGGEPFIRSDFSYIYEELIRLGIRISINTNGTLLNKEILKTLKAYPPEQINLTLYGASRETYQGLCGNGYSYDMAMDHLKEMKEANLPLALNTTFTRLNIGDMSKLIQIGKQEEIPVRMAAFTFPSVFDGVEEILLSPEEMGKARAVFESKTLTREWFERRKAHLKTLSTEKLSDVRVSDLDKVVTTGSRCMAGSGAFWISWDGQMYPCGMLRRGEDVRSSGFEEAWRRVRKKAGDLKYPEECLICRKRKVCPFCQAVFENLGQSMKVVRACVCRQTDAYIKNMKI